MGIYETLFGDGDFRRLEQDIVKNRGDGSTSHSVSHRVAVQTFSKCAFKW